MVSIGISRCGIAEKNKVISWYRLFPTSKPSEDAKLLYLYELQLAISSSR